MHRLCNSPKDFEYTFVGTIRLKLKLKLKT